MAKAAPWNLTLINLGAANFVRSPNGPLPNGPLPNGPLSNGSLSPQWQPAGLAYTATRHTQQRPSPPPAFHCLSAIFHCIFTAFPWPFHHLSTTFPAPPVLLCLQGRPGRPLRACCFGDGPLPCCLVRPRTTPGRRPAGSDRRGPTAVPARLARARLARARLARARLARAGRPGRCRRGGSGGRVSRRPPPPPLTRFDCVLIPTHFSSSDSYSDTLFIVRLFPKGGGMTGSWA